MKKLTFTIALIALSLIGYTQQPVQGKQIWITSTDQQGVQVKSISHVFTGYVVALLEHNKATGLNELIYNEYFNSDEPFALNLYIPFVANPEREYRLWVSAGGNGYYSYFNQILTN